LLPLSASPNKVFPMSDHSDIRSEFVEIAKLNGDFRKHYGKIVGGFLYLRSISALRGHSIFRNGLIFTALVAALTWLRTHGWSLSW
jgi:D-serine dehydratase